MHHSPVRSTDWASASETMQAKLDRFYGRSDWSESSPEDSVGGSPEAGISRSPTEEDRTTASAPPAKAPPAEDWGAGEVAPIRLFDSDDESVDPAPAPAPAPASSPAPGPGELNPPGRASCCRPAGWPAGLPACPLACSHAGAILLRFWTPFCSYIFKTFLLKRSSLSPSSMFSARQPIYT
jgi:hypothetical protein